jgi:hypothetical protein
MTTNVHSINEDSTKQHFTSAETNIALYHCIHKNLNGITSTCEKIKLQLQNHRLWKSMANNQIRLNQTKFNADCKADPVRVTTSTFARRDFVQEIVSGSDSKLDSF